MARRPQASRRRGVVLVAIVAALLAVVALDSSSWILRCRVIDDRSIAVTTAEGTGAWTRVASVDETASSVTIAIRSWRIQIGPGTGAGTLTESVVVLRDPLGTRTVIDGSTGLAVALAP